MKYVTHTHICEDRIMKSTKHWKEEKGGKGLREYNRGGELLQTTLYASMASKWKVLVLLIYARKNKKVNITQCIHPLNHQHGTHKYLYFYIPA
jgi:hypothetical protein